MKYVCIIVETQDYDKGLEVMDAMEKLGFKKNVFYTSDNNSKYFKVVSDSKLNEMGTKERLLYTCKEYSIAAPYGGSRHVSLCRQIDFDKIHEVYGEQAIPVYIGAHEAGMGIEIDGDQDINGIVADIIQNIR